VVTLDFELPYVIADTHVMGEVSHIVHASHARARIEHQVDDLDDEQVRAAENGDSWFRTHLTKRLGMVEVEVTTGEGCTSLSPRELRELEVKGDQPKPDEWWHRLEAGDVFLDQYGRERKVAEVSSDWVCILDGGKFWPHSPLWHQCTPPLHLDPEVAS
jgi:hypothetical protein